MAKRLQITFLSLFSLSVLVFVFFALRQSGFMSRAAQQPVTPVNPPPATSNDSLQLRTFGYATSTPAEGKTSSESLTGNNSVPLYKQWDPRWAKISYGCGDTIAAAGSGITSLAMVITQVLGKEVLPPETAKKAIEKGWRSCTDGTMWEAITGIPTLYGLKAKSISWDEAKRYLAQNIPVIQSHGSGYFTSGGHFIVLAGVQSGKYLVRHPDGNHRTEATEEQITASMKAQWVVMK